MGGWWAGKSLGTSRRTAGRRYSFRRHHSRSPGRTTLSLFAYRASWFTLFATFAISRRTANNVVTEEYATYAVAHGLLPHKVNAWAHLIESATPSE